MFPNRAGNRGEDRDRGTRHNANVKKLNTQDKLQIYWIEIVNKTIIITYFMKDYSFETATCPLFRKFLEQRNKNVERYNIGDAKPLFNLH